MLLRRPARACLPVFPDCGRLVYSDRALGDPGSRRNAMPVLHLDNVPEELYGRIEQLAAAEQVPLTEETVRLLRQAVELNRPTSRAHVVSLLEEIRRNRITPAPGTP